METPLLPCAAGPLAQSDDAFGALTMRCDLGQGAWRVVIKDCIDIAGLPTRQGSAVLADAPPAARHADVVAALLADPRWRIVGKAVMHEFAFGMTGVNPRCGTPVNPRWPDCIPGGSSSGSAVAVAGGLADMAIGSDTGGSVRLPAACCGVVGFKPGYGLVSRRGAWPAASSLDCIGVFARTVAMVETAMEAIAPGFARAEQPLSRIGVVAVDADAPVRARVAAALASLPVAQRALPGLDAAFAAAMALIGHESWAALAPYADHPAMGEDVRARVVQGGTIDAATVRAARDCGLAFAAQVDAALAGVDALAMPTLPSVPPTLAQANDPRSILPLSRMVRPFNLSGHPAITLPLPPAADSNGASTERSLPVGLQLVGRRGDDAALLATARQVERALAAHTPFLQEN